MCKILLKFALAGAIGSGSSTALLAQQPVQPENSSLPHSRIIGKVSDGSPSHTPALKKKPSPYQIHWSKRTVQNGRQIILNRVATPAPLPVAQETHRPLTSNEIRARQEHLRKWELDQRTKLGGSFAVFATIYDHRTTLLHWTHQGENFTAWSNVDWNHLGGFPTFQARAKRYSMLLLTSNYSTAQLQKEQRAGYLNSLPDIPKLPPLTQGARYTITEGDTSNEEAMEFIEAIHELYDAHKKELARAYQGRLKNWKIQQIKREQLRKNPSPKPPLVINYWKEKIPSNANPNKKTNTNQSGGKETK